jgi:3(or 17)beta-hydroxysteroid dehydrogenase
VKRLEGKTALVTHAASGIGSALVGAFVANGATVIATDSTDERDESAVESLGLQDSIDVVTRPLDVTQMAAWWDLANFVIGFVDKLDILAHNLPIEAHRPARGLRVEEFRESQATGADSALVGVNRLLVPLTEAAEENAAGSSVIFITPPVANQRGPDLFAYNALKAAVSGVTRSMALEFAADGSNIRVNAIHPGCIDTPAVDDPLARLGGDREAARRAAVELTPLKRLGDPNDVAMGAVYLASDEAKFVTGVELAVDGGAAIHP